MIMLQSIKLVVWCSGMLLVSTLTGANAQVPEPKGPVAKPLLNLDLAPEMDSVRDRVMRMQLTTYEPGASNKPHSHKDRPEVVYILSGKVIEHRGDVAHVFGVAQVPAYRIGLEIIRCTRPKTRSPMDSCGQFARCNSWRGGCKHKRQPVPFRQ